MMWSLTQGFNIQKYNKSHYEAFYINKYRKNINYFRYTYVYLNEYRILKGNFGITYCMQSFRRKLLWNLKETKLTLCFGRVSI